MMEKSKHYWYYIIYIYPKIVSIIQYWTYLQKYYNDKVSHILLPTFGEEDIQQIKEFLIIK